MDIKYASPELQAYREINKILEAHAVTGHQRDAMRACAEVIDKVLAAQRAAISAALVEQSNSYAEQREDDLPERMKHYYRGKSSGLMRAAILTNEFEGGA